jgi:hypothetical protein
MLWTRFLQLWFPLSARQSNSDFDSHRRTQILIADGVGGLDLCTRGLQCAITWQELDAELEAIPWSHGKGRWLSDLTDTSNHAHWSLQIARRVQEYRVQAGPSRCIHLVGKSGGCQIILNALEQLPPASVDSAVLIAPAIHPERDLLPALSAIRNALHVFWSPLDVLILGLGTWMFGTADRRRGVAAGCVGFRPRNQDHPALLAKLHQIRWHPAMARTGYLGGHVGPDLPWFHRSYILPLFQGESQSPASVSRGKSGPRLGCARGLEDNGHNRGTPAAAFKESRNPARSRQFTTPEVPIDGHHEHSLQPERHHDRRGPRA